MENGSSDGELCVCWVPPDGKNRQGTLTVHCGEASLTDRVDLIRFSARRALVDKIIERWPGVDGGELERQLDVLAAREAERTNQPGAETADRDPAELLTKMPEGVRAEARAMLESPSLLEQLGADFSAIGIAGERTLAGTIYLAGISRLLERPLALLIQGPSSSGKSHVLRRVARLFPPEAVFRVTTLSTLSLYYAKPGTFRHRFVVSGERSRRTNEDQAEVTRALREMLSEGGIERLVTVKRHDGAPTAELVTQEGPIAYAESTTLATSDVFTEDLNRMLLVTTDETPQQTKAVLQQVARWHERGPRTDPARVVQKHHAAQRMLRALPVKIPYATALVELLPSTALEIRRGAGYILAMVEASALLHQYQRQETGDGELVATLDDYRLARTLLSHPLGRLLGRVVSDGALRFLGRLVEWFGVGGEYTIPQAKARETHSRSGAYGWNSDLAGAGLVEMVEGKRGNAPARWTVAKSPDQAEESLTLLPEAEALENA